MDHVTKAEITDQPRAIDAVLAALREQESEIAAAVSPSTTFCLTGCGTSYYLSLSGNARLNEVATSVAVPGSEALISPDQLPADDVDVIVPVSRSGESTETVRATEALQDRYPDATVLGLTCTEGSTIYGMADIPVLSPEGEEESVVMTKSFSSMLVAFEYIAQMIETNGTGIGGFGGVSAKFDSLAAASESVVDRSDDVARELGAQTEFEKFVFLGAGECFGLASEAMLKLEEMTLSWTKAYHTLEFRHGPQSIAEEDTLVTILVPERELDLHADLVDDVNDLGATTLVVGTSSAIDELDADYTVELPDQETANMALYAPPFQLLGYYRAVATNLNPDEPQHLSQVVTF